MKQKDKPKKKLITYDPGQELGEEIEDECARTGVAKSELNRRGMKQYFDDRRNDCALMLNVVLLAQQFKELKGSIAENQYEQIETYINNIMILKGGK